MLGNGDVQILNPNPSTAVVYLPPSGQATKTPRTTQFKGLSDDIGVCFWTELCAVPVGDSRLPRRCLSGTRASCVLVGPGVFTWRFCSFPSDALGIWSGGRWCSECAVSRLPDRWHARGALRRLVLTDPCQSPPFKCPAGFSKPGFPSGVFLVIAHLLILRRPCQLMSIESFPRIDRRKSTSLQRMSFRMLLCFECFKQETLCS